MATGKPKDAPDPHSTVPAKAAGTSPEHGNAIDAARAAGVRAVAYTSLPNPAADNPAVVAQDHRQTEALLAASGLE